MILKQANAYGVKKIRDDDDDKARGLGPVEYSNVNVLLYNTWRDFNLKCKTCKNKNATQLNCFHCHICAREYRE